NASRGGGRKTEDLLVQNAINIHDDQGSVPARPSRSQTEAGAEPHGMHGQEVHSLDILLIELVMSARKPRIDKVFESRHHGPSSREQFVEEEALLYSGVPALLNVVRNEPALFASREPKRKNYLGEIVRWICHVQLILPQAMVLEIRLEKRGRPGDPFL